MSARITIKQLEAFVNVADMGAFNRAAERLGTTQPNISSRIASLESLLGVTLMQRDAGSVRLTLNGRELLKHARKVLSSVDDFQMAAGNTTLIDGVLRLGVTEMVAHTWLRDFLKAMRVALPNVAIELSVDLSANIEKDLLQRSIDLAFHNAPFRQDIDGSVDLGQWPLIWVAAPEVLNLTTNLSSVGSLHNQKIITHSRGTSLHDEVIRHFSAAGHPAQGITSSTHLGACLHMAKEGFGITIVPETMASGALKRGTLTRVPYEWLPKPLHFKARFEAERSMGFVREAAQIAAQRSQSWLENAADDKNI